VLKTPFRNSFERRADRASSDSSIDWDALALREQSVADPVNFFGGTSPADTVTASAGAAPGSDATVQPSFPGVASTPVNVEAAPTVTVAEGASVEIAGASAQSVTFTGTTGTLKLDHSLAFTGQITGLAGTDGIDLADVSFGVQTQVTFLGNAAGGTLTITDGINTANIALQGDYLSSTWTLSSDGDGGTIVVDPVASTTWQTLDVGAGGWVRNLDIAPDGTMVGRTDTYGAYRWNGTQWVQLVTSASMPAAFLAANAGSGNTGQGVYEIQIADSNTQIFYMMFDGYVFKSTNQGTTWTQTSFAQVTAGPNDSFAQYGQKMAIDPNNPNIVYVGSSTSGLFVTTDGGVTWQRVSQVPVSALDSSGDGNSPGITGILFDPAVGGVVNGVTQTIFAESNGNGVYRSTNGGASWTLLSGGPTTVVNAAVSSTGVYYATDGTDLWSFANGTWTKPQTSINGAGIQAVAVNPSNPNEIVLVSPAGYLDVSYDAGATWSGIDWSSNSVNSTDIPWLKGANEGANSNYLTIGGAAFNPLVPNQLIASAGTGVWNASVPTSNLQWNTPVTWNDQSLGIEQLVANSIIVAPGGKPVLASWDRPFIYVSDINAYPTTYGPVDSSDIVAGWSIDYASSSPNFLVGIAEWWGKEESGYSTDGGQTWTPFASEIPGASTQFMGGTIAASSPTNIVWAPAGGFQPYYTTNGGQTWSPVVLPGVSSWANFDFAYYLDTRTVTADRVLTNTFYLFDAGQGLFTSTNGGATWTKTYSGDISLFDNFNAELLSVPSEAGNLFFTGGPMPSYPAEPFMRSTNGGATWTAVANVTQVSCFGFGAPSTTGGYPAIYIVGYVNNVYGIWQSVNNAQSWTQIGTYPNGSLDTIKTISGDPNIYGQVYVGFQGSGYAVLVAPSSSGSPSVTAVATSPSSGDLNAGNTVTLTVSLSSAVTIAGGTPTLTLNDGGTATYTGGSGSTALTFSYTVGAGQNTADLAVTAVNLNSATVKDGSGNAADLTGAVTNPSGTLQIDTTAPTVASVAASGTGTGIASGAGDLATGSVVTLTVNLSEAVTVAGGTPTLTLNDGGTATYTGGSGSTALTFSYTVGAGQNTVDLAVTAVNLNSATVKDGAGNAANLTGVVTNPSGTLQIDTTAPSVASVIASPGSGAEFPGNIVTLTLAFGEAVTVTGTPTLTLNDGGTATYTGGSGSTTLTFSYTVGPTDSTVSALAITQANLPNGAAIKDAAGNAANLSGALVTFPNLAIDPPTPGPTLTSIVESPSTGDLNAGNTVTLTLNLSSAVTVIGGTPTLTLNDGGTATYTGGSGSTALTFSYTVAAGQNTASLAATAVNLNGAAVQDGSGNAASLSPSGLTQTGPRIDTAAPVISSIAETPSSGDLNAGKIVIYTLTMSEAVSVNTTGGSPTLTLNDGGSATYTGGSGSNALTFSYTVLAGQNTPDLMVSAVNLNGATLLDGAGNGASVSLTGLTQGSPQIDTTAPSVASVAASGTGITAGTGDLATGSVVTLTVNLSEAVTVAGGTPTLTLNDGGTATYTGGSGSTALTFSYTVAAGQNTVDLAVTAVNLNSATVKDGAGNAANLTGVVTNPSGTLQIDTTAPSVSSVGASGTGITAGAGNLATGSVVTLTVNLSEAVTVAGGTPMLTLNDGGTATYTGGSGSTALTFSYTVAAGQNTADLAVTAVNLGTATVSDSAGNAADLTGAAINPSGTLQIDTSRTVIEAIGSTKLDQVGNNYSLDSSGGGSGPVLKFNGGAVVAGQFGSWTPIGVEQTSTGYEVAWKVPGADVYSVWSTDSNGNYTGKNLFMPGSGTSSTLESLETGFHQDLNGDGVIGIPLVAAGQTLELTGAYSGTIAFAAVTGTLKIDDSATFSGTISGQLAIGDVIDLADITAGANAAIAYSGNNSPGTLTVSDGIHIASIALLGNYSLANFTASSDGHGGTSVVDPPLPTDQSSNFLPQASGAGSVAWLNAVDQKLALWSQQIASAFPTSSFDNGLKSTVSISEFGGQPSQFAAPVAETKYLSSFMQG
jgi:hypothetical protein